MNAMDTSIISNERALNLPYYFIKISAIIEPYNINI